MAFHPAEAGPAVAADIVSKAQATEIRNKMVSIMDRVRELNQARKSQDEISETIVKDFGWGSGPSAGQFSGMLQELR